MTLVIIFYHCSLESHMRSGVTRTLSPMMPDEFKLLRQFLFTTLPMTMCGIDGRDERLLIIIFFSK